VWIIHAWLPLLLQAVFLLQLLLLLTPLGFAEFTKGHHYLFLGRLWVQFRPVSGALVLLQESAP